MSTKIKEWSIINVTIINVKKDPNMFRCEKNNIVQMSIIVNIIHKKSTKIIIIIIIKIKL